jgi:hypothetical protein
MSFTTLRTGVLVDRASARGKKLSVQIDDEGSGA